MNKFFASGLLGAVLAASVMADAKPPQSTGSISTSKLTVTSNGTETNGSIEIPQAGVGFFFYPNELGVSLNESTAFSGSLNFYQIDDATDVDFYAPDEQINTFIYTNGATTLGNHSWNQPRTSAFGNGRGDIVINSTSAGSKITFVAGSQNIGDAAAVIDATGVKINGLAGPGNVQLCVDLNGKLYRGSPGC